MSQKPSERELLEATRYQYRFSNPQAVFTHTTKTYDPPSSSSGGEAPEEAEAVEEAAGVAVATASKAVDRI